MDETLLQHGATDRPIHYGKPEAHNHAEISGAMIPAQWIEKDPLTGFKTYPKRNQGLAGDCVDYSYAKAIGVDVQNIISEWRELSPHSLYAFTCEPGGGSNSLDAGTKVSSIGMTLEILFPSDNLSEAQAESQTGYAIDAKNVALLYRPNGVMQCPTDFDTIASILQTYQAQGKNKVVMVTLIGQNNGSWYSSQPKIPNVAPNSNDATLWYHKVPICDFGTIGGKRVLAIDNSWGTAVGNQGQQFLTEDWIAYIYGGLYTIDPTDLSGQSPTTVPAPTYTWTTQLQIGSTGADVTALQIALQSMGMFPTNSIIKPTGNYFGITKQAVETFQQSFGLTVNGIVDNETMLKLNEIFGAPSATPPASNAAGESKPEGETSA